MNKKQQDEQARFQAEIEVEVERINNDPVSKRIRSRYTRALLKAQAILEQRRRKGLL